tara:strand:- start:3897 stop:4142 length:246 start_codon:yes stop_codon:yes gene_type:complete
MREKYPENIPWDSDSNLDKSIQVKWMLTKDDNVYTFKRSRMNNEYVYIQKNKGSYKAFKEYSARFTYQRLFDEGYLLAAVA